MKNIRFFYVKNCHFLVVKFSVYLNRRVFVMGKIKYIDSSSADFQIKKTTIFFIFLLKAWIMSTR